MIIQGKLLNPKDDLKDVFEIRRKVFIEELGLFESLEFDDIDHYAIHAIAFVEDGDKKPVATGRLYFDGDNCYLEKLSVLENYRGRQYGEFILRMLLNKADMSGIKKVYVKGRRPYINYFEKFEFLPVNIPECDDKEVLFSISTMQFFSRCKH